MRTKIVYSGSTPKFFVNDVEVTEEEYKAATPSKLNELLGEECLPAQHPGAWGGMRSEAMAVHPEQIPEVLARNKKHGLGNIEYDRAGRPILKDRGMRRDLMRLEGVHDKNGGYGD